MEGGVEDNYGFEDSMPTSAESDHVRSDFLQTRCSSLGFLYGGSRYSGSILSAPDLSKLPCRGLDELDC